MWISIAVVVLAVSILSIVFCRQHKPAAEASRWLGPMHFTIPILSPFASVIEHETSAVNVQLVAVLVLFAGIFGFLWYRCAPRRR
ncbi:hypothetical protein C8Q77DRAFT_1112744 [Trametes polyzona]|nr:hypothetical protein C8Q77DRAFT_1112744 [Trametes polyzona]